jgi:hypothetical protein
MIQFHETGYGKRFFDGQLPALISSLQRIAVSLEAREDEPDGEHDAAFERKLLNVFHDAEVVAKMWVNKMEMTTEWLNAIGDLEQSIKRVRDYRSVNGVAVLGTKRGDGGN